MADKPVGPVPKIRTEIEAVARRMGCSAVDCLSNGAFSAAFVLNMPVTCECGDSRSFNDFELAENWKERIDALKLRKAMEGSSHAD